MKRRILLGASLIICMAFVVLSCSEGLLGGIEDLRDKAIEINSGGKNSTVTFHANGGTGNVPSAETVARGSLLTLPGDDGFTRTNYTFGGWNTKTDGAGNNFAAGSSYPVTGNITLYAKWNADCTVTFDANNAPSGSGSAPPSSRVPEGTVITLPGAGDLASPGYVFGGWNTLAGGEGTNYASGSSYRVTGDITLFAKWNARCIVYFRPNGGSGAAPSDMEAGRGTDIILPGGGGLTKDDASFAGWNTLANGNGTTYPAGFPYRVTEPITELYAKWSDSYTVTFNINNGSGTTPPAQTANTNSSVPIPGGSGFSRAGTNGAGAYTFAGWNTQADGLGTNIPGPNYMPNANTTLYARWTSTVTYSGNDNTGGTAPAASGPANAGASITLAQGTGLSRTDYTFNGWNTNTSGTGTNRNAGSSYMPTGNITLHAKWSHTVTFNANGGTPASTTQIVDNGAKVPQPAGVTRGTYVLEGWYRETGFTNKWDFANHNVTSNMTLYAKWTSTVTYDINNGSGTTPPVSAPVTAGESITLPGVGNLTRRGYGFGGWSTTATGTAVASSYTPTGNITLFARWNELNDPQGSTLAQKLDWIELNSRTGGDYAITVSANETLETLRTLSTGTGYTSYKVTLVGSGTERIISHSGSVYGSMFTINSGVTLTLGSNITLQGPGTNNGALVHVQGTLIMNAGSKITGNTSYKGMGLVVDNGILTMNGGEISGNTGSGNGGGVYMYGANSVFTMSGGKISGNTSSYDGGGVYVAGGKFTMSGGTIGGLDIDTETDNNRAANKAGQGSGVFVSGSGSEFTMSGGTISGNTAAYNGGGVFLQNSGKFTMSGNAAISDNITAGSGGGVWVAANCSFTMKDTSSISENKAHSGGGVTVTGAGSDFTMSGGTISGNVTTGTAGPGGGVGVGNYGKFTMTGGTIGGAGAAANTATHVGGGVYIDSNSTFIMEGGGILGNTATTSGGGVLSHGYFHMTGGEITANTAGAFGKDMCIDGSSTFEMSLGAKVTDLALVANSTTYKSKVAIGANFTGSVASLNLVGGSNLVNNKDNWTGSAIKVIEGLPGVTLTDTILNKFPLGDFCYWNGYTVASEPISDGYHLYGTKPGETTQANFGLLVGN